MGSPTWLYPEKRDIYTLSCVPNALVTVWKTLGESQHNPSWRLSQLHEDGTVMIVLGLCLSMLAFV